MVDVSEACLLDYIYSSGGKVKNADLLKTYKPFISHNDLQLRAQYRQEFKRIIDTIAVCKSENGEKYLVLKKKYKQLIQEREGGVEEGWSCDGPELQSWSPAAQHGSSVMAARKPPLVSWCGMPAITVSEAQQQDPTEDRQQSRTSCSERSLKRAIWRRRAARDKMAPAGQKTCFADVLSPGSAAEAWLDFLVVEKTDSCPSLLVENPALPEEHLQLTDKEEELNKDSGSKSESEQEEESTGSVGSVAVALDPMEKEWMYSAACARLPHLTQLLKHDASLANKKDFTSFTALHWAAKHGKQDMAVAMVHAGADVNTKAHVSNYPQFAVFMRKVALYSRRRGSDTAKKVEVGGWRLEGAPPQLLSTGQRGVQLQEPRLCPLCHALSPFSLISPCLLRARSGGHVTWDAQGGYTPLHIAALHGHRHIIELLITTYGAKENLRDYSGHLASHYLNIHKTEEETAELISEYHSPAQASERRNRKLTSLFQSRKKWGSAEELAPVPEERAVPHQLMIPAFRPRKFSR
ncbi:ankyrin repeat domain-containing protein SOWAHA [Brachyhypopomus gauderio]|uniref:ankyrin repeat domain-containing protein SOWAHA n=1 Tax=Brachyhypopomus gauderio TaxID=698409 RepID=UPI004041A188